MAKVPDLGSDFAQKLLKDLRRRRERLGFESSAASAQRSTASAARPGAYSNSPKPLQVQKPQQAAPRVARSEGATNRLYRQGNSSVAGPGKPRRHVVPPIAQSHAIVPFQGGGNKQMTPAANADVDVQMALALALSNSGKLQNVQLVARHGPGSMLFSEPDRTKARHFLAPGAHVGKVAIGVQKLNDILMAYSSGAAGARRGSVEMGKQLLRGAMDLEESLSMLMMLQEASDYMETSGNGKMLLLEGKENWKSTTPRSTSSASARLVEIFDEDSETEHIDNKRSSSDSSMQIVPHSKFHRPNGSSSLQITTVTGNHKSNANSGEKNDSKVRMPNLIAKLMGLDNLPSAKAVTERKGTERFVKREAVQRKAAAKNDMVGTLPIRIVASERVPSKGQIKNLQAREWNITLTRSEESVLSNRFSHLTADMHTRQTMRQVLSKQESTERTVSLSQVVNEKIVHQDMKLNEENKLQKTVGAECRSDAGKKMNFLQRFRKNAKNKPATEERHIVQENKQKLGKKQTTSIKQSLGRDRQVKSGRIREKYNKEILASAENKSEGKNGRTNQMRRQVQSKQTDRKIIENKAQNYHQMQSETASQKLEHKRSLKSEPTQTKEKLEDTAMMQQTNVRSEKEDNICVSKPLDNTLDGGIVEQITGGMNHSSTTGGTSSDQSEEQITEEINDPTTTVAQTTADSISDTSDNRVNQTLNQTTQILGAFAEGEQQRQQLQRMKEVNDQSRNGSDLITKPGDPTVLRNHKMNIVSCDAFTENQLLLTEMLLKDPYLLETAKTITRIHVPVSVVQVNTGKWLDKGNKVLSDIGREVIRRKGKRTEAMVDVSMTRAASLKLQTLDDLIRELDGDIQSLNISKKPHQQRDNSTAENLKMVLRSDIENTHSDANSVWDFGWNRLWDLPIEKNEVVKDLEKNILGGILTDVARELIDVSIRHGFCPCEV